MVAGGPCRHSYRRDLEFLGFLIFDLAQGVTIASSRFSGLGRFYSQLIVLLLAASVALSWAMAPVAKHGPQKSAASSKSSDPMAAVSSDTELYEQIIIRVARGENYYAAATHEQRSYDYPTQPFATVRLPTLAVASATIGNQARNLLAGLLAFAVVLIWYRRVSGVIPNPLRRFPTALLALTGFVIFIVPRCLELHDIWAGALIALSIGIYRAEKYWPAVLAAAAALAIREHAVPFIMLMGTVAFWERRWREGAVWTAIVAIFAAVLYAHASAVQAHVLPGDLTSQGWVRFGGITTAINALTETSGLLALLPRSVMPLIFPFAIFGWLSWKSEIGLRVSLYILGYCLMLALFGREDNFYWAFLIAPLVLIGLVFVPRALHDLVANMRGVARI
jgi:hypothetical protein